MIFADKSFSMNGGPWEALQVALTGLAEEIYADPNDDEIFNSLHLCYYNTKVDAIISKTKEEFLKVVKSQKPKGLTNFIKCFNYINKHVVEYTNGQGRDGDINIIFLTDGCDTLSTNASLINAQAKLKATLKDLHAK